MMHRQRADRYQIVRNFSSFLKLCVIVYYLKSFMYDIACTVWSSLNSIAIIAAGPSRVELTMIEVVKIEYKWDKRMAVFLVKFCSFVIAWM